MDLLEKSAKGQRGTILYFISIGCLPAIRSTKSSKWDQWQSVGWYKPFSATKTIATTETTYSPICAANRETSTVANHSITTMPLYTLTINGDMHYHNFAAHLPLPSPTPGTTTLSTSHLCQLLRRRRVEIYFARHPQCFYRFTTDGNMTCLTWCKIGQLITLNKNSGYVTALEFKASVVCIVSCCISRWLCFGHLSYSLDWFLGGTSVLVTS